MSKGPIEAAVRATAQEITNDDARAVKMGADSLPPDEVIVEPNPSDYVAPAYLAKTAPELAGAFAELLVTLRDLNARFAGARTVEVQAYLSLTGEHEELEERFLAWCQRYFEIRGSLDRLSPRNENDPWLLFQQCLDEYTKLLDYRIVQPGTVNSSVLNLSQRFMKSSFPASVLEDDLANYAKFRQDRFGTMSRRSQASRLVIEYKRRVQSFTSFLTQVGQNLPSGYSQNSLPSIRAKVAQQAEDLRFLRYVLCVLNFSEAEKRQVAPGLWARFHWDVYHWGSIGVILTSDSPEPSTERTTDHEVAVRRDGWLCHREFSWLRVHPDYKADERQNEFAVNWFILDKLTAPLYEAWGGLDPEPVISRALKPDATVEEQTAGLAVAFAEPDTTEVLIPAPKRPRLPQLRLMRIKHILIDHFDCEWSKAKGSEQKVYRPGAKPFKFGCHGVDRTISPDQLRSCLVRLGIPLSDFFAFCRRPTGG
jgi:hypothetical protein